MEREEKHPAISKLTALQNLTGIVKTGNTFAATLHLC